MRKFGKKYFDFQQLLELAETEIQKIYPDRFGCFEITGKLGSEIYIMADTLCEYDGSKCTLSLLINETTGIISEIKVEQK